MILWEEYLMAATAAIIINQSGKPAGLPSTSRDDLDLGTSVALSNNDNVGITSWAWEFISKPPGSAAVLLTPTTSVSSFTPDIRGSYFIRLTISDGLSTDIDERIAAVKTSYLDIRIPAAEEKTEFDSTIGWATAMHSAFITIDGSLNPIKLSEIADPSPYANDGYLYTKDDSGDTEFFYMDNYGRITQITKDGYINAAELGYHASSHTRSGVDEIDGDTLDIDWDPINYVPATVPSEVSSIDELTAHLYGIDGYLHVLGSDIENLDYTLEASDELDSTGSETSLSLSETPLTHPSTDSGYALDVFLNGVRIKYVGALGIEPTEWTYNSGLNRVEFVASGENDWYLARYVTTAGVTTSSNNTLDQAYNEGGGAGAGRTISIDSGAVVLDGSATSTQVIDADGYAVFTGDVEISTAVNGVILKSPNGTRYRITVDNTGNLVTASI
jgi:hypothetical protein